LKVKCITDKGGGGYIKEGRVYVVYSMFIAEDGLHYLLSDPEGAKDLPMPHSADMFVIIDHLLPIGWYFYFIDQSLSEKRQDLLRMIWGYKEMIFIPDHYSNLIERDPKALEIFARRKEEIDEYEELISNKRAPNES